MYFCHRAKDVVCLKKVKNMIKKLFVRLGSLSVIHRESFVFEFDDRKRMMNQNPEIAFAF